jgi:23S rRNA U2552 (ribose-2'-O)-methylase RlmE/FtsJ
VNVIISDMAPNFSGSLEDDHYDMVKLNAMSVTTALHLLKGDLVMKSLAGPLEKPHFTLYSQLFSQFFREKPASSRSSSNEFYYVGLSLK